MLGRRSDSHLHLHAYSSGNRCCTTKALFLGLLLNKCHSSAPVEGFKDYSLLFVLNKTGFKCNICREREARSCGVGSVSGK